MSERIAPKSLLAVPGGTYAMSKHRRGILP